MANSVDPDQTSVDLDQTLDLHSLFMPTYPKT